MRKKEGWELKIIDSIAARWKKRRKSFEKVEEETKAEGDMLLQENHEQHRQIKENCQHEMASCQELLYQHVADDSMQKNSFDALLLPSTSLPATCEERVKSYVEVKGIDRVNLVSSIQLEQEKTRKALEQVRYYRNLAEKLRKEKRNTVLVLNDKIELVRDFWRNKILEGSTRAGKMVQRALNRKHYT